MTMSEEIENLANQAIGKWIVVHIIGSIIAVLGALYLLTGMQLLPNTPATNFQAGLMLAGGLIMDFFGVIKLTKVLRARKAAKNKS